MSNDVLRVSVLTSFAAGPQHGYGVLRDVEMLTDGAVSPPVGSLYRVLDALARDGLIADDREEVVGGRLRRYYRITERGLEELAGTANTMSRLAAHAKKRLRAGHIELAPPDGARKVWATK